MSLVLLAATLVVSQAAADTVVVCPAALREALEPWMAYRTGQGHEIAVVSNSGSPGDIRRRIAEAADGGRLRFVLLVGDAEPAARIDPAVRARCVPVCHAKAEVNVLWGSEPHIATDNYYADLDDDAAPELAVGRLPADTPQQLQQMVAKILRYERSPDVGAWRRRVNVVAGVGGFGPLADRLIESSARYLLTQGIPADYELSMTYASWRSPYCPDPRLFNATTLWRLNQGCWFWVYLGHGFHLGLDRLRAGDGEYRILDVDDVAKLACPHGAPIALFFSCYTGAFDATDDCLAEHLLRQPGGPVAVLAASRVTMPYAMALLATNLMDECFVRRRPTLGEAVLHAKRAMVEPRADEDELRAMLDAVAAALSPDAQRLADERAEHLLLFNLLGDPLLRLKYPQPIELQVPSTVTAGRPLPIAGTAAIDGRGTLELVVRRDRLAFDPPPRGRFTSAAGPAAALQQAYHRANDPALARVEITVVDGRFQTTLDVPETARGECHVRAFVEGTDGFALGAADVEIERAPRTATQSPPADVPLR